MHQFGDLAITTFTKQLLFLIPAIVGFLTILFIPKYIIHKYIYAAYSLMLILILVPFLFDTIAGTHRWINIGLPVGVQPSEFAKWIVVVALARYLSDHNLRMKRYCFSTCYNYPAATGPWNSNNTFDTYFAYVVLGRCQAISFVHTCGSSTEHCYCISHYFLYCVGDFNG